MTSVVVMAIATTCIDCPAHRQYHFAWCKA